jgi:Na+/H+-dicarboxylate symporter
MANQANSTKKRSKKMPLHVKILIGMFVGIIFGFVAVNFGGPSESQIAQANKQKLELDNTIAERDALAQELGKLQDSSQLTTSNDVDFTRVDELKKEIDQLDSEIVALRKSARLPDAKGKSFVIDWIKPWGQIFVNLLKLIAIPLIVASLLKGISDLKDMTKFRKIGGRSMLMYIGTTIIAICLGLVVVNIIDPGLGISKDTMETMTQNFGDNPNLTSKIDQANAQNEAGPLDFFVNIVPNNIFEALRINENMLQVIFFVIFFGITMLLLPAEKVRPVKDFFDALNDIVLKMVDLIMLAAPIAVFALIAAVIVSSEDPAILKALLWYAMAVVIGLILMMGVYLLIIGIYVKKSPFWFLKRFAPAQLMAFTTSSSAAALPVTMECVEEHLGVEKEVSSFVLPVGATINMDGTSLYQAVAAVFIAQALGVELGMMDQAIIVLTALMASIGAAAVPGAGMIMLVIVLQSIGKFTPEQIAIGLALIFAVDRPLDMLRTTINVTGDAVVAMAVAKSVGKLKEPKPQDWDDYTENIHPDQDKTSETKEV